jgi:hypothetical protein
VSSYRANRDYGGSRPVDMGYPEGVSTLEILYYGFLTICGLGIVTALLKIWAAILQIRINRRTTKAPPLPE